MLTTEKALSIMRKILPNEMNAMSVMPTVDLSPAFMHPDGKERFVVKVIHRFGGGGDPLISCMAKSLTVAVRLAMAAWSERQARFN